MDIYAYKIAPNIKKLIPESIIKLKLKLNRIEE